MAALTFGLRTPAFIVADSASYLDPARAWAGGWGLTEIDGRPLQGRLPAYPLALGWVIWWLGESPTAFTLLNVAFHVAAILAVHRAVGEMTSGPSDHRDVVAALALVYPPLLTSAALVLQESLVAFLLAAAYLASVRAFVHPSGRRAFLAGVCLGLACLAKVTALPLTLPLAAGLWRTARPSILRGTLAVLGVGAVLGPWAARNGILVGRFEVTNNNGGAAFLGGTVSNVVDWGDFAELREAMARWEAGEKARYSIPDRFFYHVALERIASDPAKWLGLVMGRFGRFVLPARGYFVAAGYSRTGTFGPWYVAAIGLQLVLFGAAMVLGCRAVRRGAWAHLTGPVIILTHWVTYALTFVTPRYNVTVGPILVGCLALVISARSGSRTWASAR